MNDAFVIIFRMSIVSCAYRDNYVKFPEIETKRLFLSDLKESDATDIFSLFSDCLVVKYYDLSEFTSIEQAQQLISLFQSRYVSGSGIRWGIRLKETNELIGTCGFNSWSERMKFASIGYDLKSSYWGNGSLPRK